MNSLAYLFITGLLFLGSSSAFGIDADQARQIAHFASKGMFPTLSTCELPQRCKGRPPLKTTKRIWETGNDELIDQRHLAFDGLKINIIYKLGYPGGDIKRRYPKPYSRPWIVEMVVSTSNWPVMYGLRVGTTRAKVERVLGPGIPHNRETIGYANEETQDEIIFRYARGKVKTITFVAGGA